MTNHPQAGTSRNPWLIGLGGFLIGIALTAAWFIDAHLPGAVAPQAAPSGSGTTASATSSLATPTQGILTVHDQAAGKSVLVDSVNVPSPGVWVAVAELRDGAMGNILGAARVTAPTANVSIPLLRSTVPATTYAVVLYRDNGDGQFNALDDSVYVDFTTGERVVALFKTTF